MRRWRTALNLTVPAVFMEISKAFPQRPVAQSLASVKRDQAAGDGSIRQGAVGLSAARSRAGLRGAASQARTAVTETNPALLTYLSVKVNAAPWVGGKHNYIGCGRCFSLKFVASGVTWLLKGF